MWASPSYVELRGRCVAAVVATCHYIASRVPTVYLVGVPQERISSVKPEESLRL